MTLGLGMLHQGLGPNKVCSNDDLGLTLTFFTARSNLLSYAVYMGKIYISSGKMLESQNGRNLQQMTLKFCPKGLSVPAPGLYTCIKA